jgi:hypothetical protein
MSMPLTVSSIDGMHTPLTEIGENGSVQRQLILPPTRTRELLGIELSDYLGRAAMQARTRPSFSAGPGSRRIFRDSSARVK